MKTHLTAKVIGIGLIAMFLLAGCGEDTVKDGPAPMTGADGHPGAKANLQPNVAGGAAPAGNASGAASTQ